MDIRKRKRNEGRTEVYGISAPREFWEEVHKQMRLTGMNRSNVIVETCNRQWKKGVVSESVGRPQKGK